MKRAVLVALVAVLAIAATMVLAQSDTKAGLPPATVRTPTMAQTPVYAGPILMMPQPMTLAFVASGGLFMAIAARRRVR